MSDPLTALAAIGELRSEDEDLTNLYESALGAWSLTDPTAAIEWMLANAESLSVGSDPAATVIAYLVPNDTEVAVSALGALPPQWQSGAAESLAAAWLAEDQASALSWVLRQEDKPYFADILNAAAIDMSNRGSQEASAWFDSLNSRAADIVRPTLVSFMTSRYPAAALRIARGLPSRQRSDTIPRIALRAAREDLQAAIAIRQELTGQPRELFDVGLAGVLAESNLPAAEEIVTDIEDGDVRDRATVGLFPMMNLEQAESRYLDLADPRARTIAALYLGEAYEDAGDGERAAAYYRAADPHGVWLHAVQGAINCMVRNVR
ncbi:MAG: hypothetical protein AAF515_01835 [Pseudomonadota bacterium]